MRKILLILGVLLVISTTTFAYNITIDGETRDYAGPSVSLILNNEPFTVSENQMPPVIIEGRTLVPVREIFEALGGKVDWNSEAKRVTIWMDENTIELEINSKLAGVNGVAKDLDVPAKIINNKTMVPVRFISENCGLKVDWNSETKTVSIEKPTTVNSGETISGEDLIEINTSGEENFVVLDDIPLYVKAFNEKFSKSFGPKKNINSTYQLCELISSNNLMGKDNQITVVYTDEKGVVTSSNNYVVINEIKTKILQSYKINYEVSGEYGSNGYLSTVFITRLAKGV